MSSPSSAPFQPLTASCACSSLSYTLLTPPLITHCCHCRSCQRETGSAFVINALLPSTSVIPTPSSLAPLLVNTPSASGKGQIMARCPKCYVAVWSNYAGGGEAIRFVRVGTIAGAHGTVPDVHIYVGSKVEWVVVPEGVERYEEFYNVDEVWGKERSLERWEVLEGIRKGREVAAAVAGEEKKDGGGGRA